MACVLYACRPAAASPVIPSASPSPEAKRSVPTEPALPTVSATLPTTVTPEATPTAAPNPMPQLCSPLAGYSLEELPAIVSNPFHPPPPGSDDPHQGVDLADRMPGSQAARPGMGVQASLAGQVAGVIADRFPYGNAVMVETRLQDLPPGWLVALALPTALPQALSNPALTCPAVTPLYTQAEPRSLYVLYAHLQELPKVQPGQTLACGDALGAVGQSGNALNPHLHFEVRLGPAQARFNSLAHYDNSATPEEMGLYCLWRVSGIFQLVDPLALLALQP